MIVVFSVLLKYGLNVVVLRWLLLIFRLSFSGCVVMLFVMFSEFLWFSVVFSCMGSGFVRLLFIFCIDSFSGLIVSFIGCGVDRLVKFVDVFFMFSVLIW